MRRSYEEARTSSRKRGCGASYFSAGAGLTSLHAVLGALGTGAEDTFSLKEKNNP